MKGHVSEVQELGKRYFRVLEMFLGQLVISEKFPQIFS